VPRAGGASPHGKGVPGSGPRAIAKRRELLACRTLQVAERLLYDAEIVPRVEIAVNERARFTDTSVWALSQRRRVWLRGCVQTVEQAKEIEAVVRHIDDVEDVQNELMVGIQGIPPYLTKRR